MRPGINDGYYIFFLQVSCHRLYIRIVYCKNDNRILSVFYKENDLNLVDNKQNAIMDKKLN